MKLLRVGEIGQERPAILDQDGNIRDLSTVVTDITASSIAQLTNINISELPIIAPNIRIGACIAHTKKFIGVGLNYLDHAAETNAPIPKEPIIFNKWTSCIVGANDDIILPDGSTKTDWEVELGVVIGSTCKNVSIEQALDYVLGYCVVNDVSEREYQLERGGSWDKGKGFDTFGPIGPWLVTKDEIEDPQNLELWLQVDGQTYQSGSTQNMIFSVAQLISYISGFVRLEAGDIITTGTPKGVGMGQKPPVYLKKGQTITLGISQLGQQKQCVK